VIVRLTVGGITIVELFPSSVVLFPVFSSSTVILAIFFISPVPLIRTLIVKIIVSPRLKAPIVQFPV
jgi:hypothetical protein